MLDAIFNVAPTPMALLDRDFRLVRVNPAYSAATGQSADALTGQDYFTTFDQAEDLAPFEQARDTGKPYRRLDPPLSYLDPTRDTLTHWEPTLTPLKDDSGAVTHLLLTLRDISDRIEANRALEESHDLMRQILDATPLGIYWKDLDSRYLGANARVAADAGLASPDALIGKRESQLNLPWKAGENDETAPASLEPLVHDERRLSMTDGQDIWLRRSWTPLLDTSGQPIGTLGLYEDITERKRYEHRLRITQAAIDRSKSAFYWIGPRGQVKYANDHACRSLGYSRAELLDTDIWLFDHIFPKDGWSDFWDEFRRKGVMQFETWHTRKDGRSFPVEITCNHIVFDDKEQGGFNFVQDISERKAAEAKLRASEERFVQFFRASPALTVISTLDEGLIIDANDRWLETMGYRREEIVGRTAKELDLWVDPEARAHLISTLDANGALRDQLIRGRDSKGVERDLLWSCQVLSLGGQPVLLSAIQDVTERRQAERALRLAQTSIQCSSDAVFWITAQGRLVQVNEQACKSLGYRREELLGMGVWEIDPGFTMEAFTTRWRAARDSKTRHFESLHRRRDGSCFPVEIISNFVDEEGEEYCFSFARDISERKQAETELARHREHLEELVLERTSALETANTNLQQAFSQLVQTEKLVALGSLVAGVAHELNTPLGNTRMVASSLAEWLDETESALQSGQLRHSHLINFFERGREAVKLLERNTSRAADLIGQFKEVAVDQTSMRRRPFNLRQTMEELLAAFGPSFKHNVHHIELSIPPDLELDSYPGPLEQVIANLINNSLTHGFNDQRKGRIEISAQAQGAEQVLLSYRDDGVGIPPEMRARIFEPFFTTRLGVGGSGLGLYIVYNLVTGLLGGTIDVDGRPNLGAHFRIRLPRTAPHTSPA